MIMLTKLTTSAIKKSLLIPLCQSGKVHNKKNPLFEKEGAGEILDKDD